MDGQTVFVALVALCGVELVLIWQVATLIDEVRTMRDEAFNTMTWFLNSAAQTMEDGDSDGNEDQ